MSHHTYAWVLLVSLVGVSHAHADPARAGSDRQQRARDRAERCEADPRVRLGLVDASVCVGAALFFHETFEGNGRTCGSCHPAQNNYTLDADFIATLSADDPLFVSEHDPELSHLEIPALLRRYGLIVVNPDGFEAPTEKFVVRSVPHMLGLATSRTLPPPHPLSATHAEDGTLVPPLERLGWSGDGSPGEGRLLDFADGAIRQHMTKRLERVPERDFVLPTDEERAAIAVFSGSIGRMQDFAMSRAKLRDPGAERGRQVFLTGNGRECSSSCHFEGNANAAILEDDGRLARVGNKTFDIGTALVRVPEVDALHIPLDGGHGTGPLDLDFDGVDDSFGNGGMNVPALIEAADTAPMYHTHAFATVEDAVGFYASPEFANSFVGQTFETDNRALGEPFPLTDRDTKDVGRMLRVLNAALNCQMASYRVEAALRIHERYYPKQRALRSGLLELAIAEIDDAVGVLSAVDRLQPNTQRLLAYTRSLLRAHMRHDDRPALPVRTALRLLARALVSLGDGLEMPLGQGTLMF